MRYNSFKILHFFLEIFPLYRIIIKIKSIFKNTSKKGGKVILAGNGGSAAMASHVAVDITKNAGIRSVTFNEYDLITTLANDYGYENWIAKAIELYHNPNDLVVLISASGQSLNVINAANIDDPAINKYIYGSE